MHVTLLAVKERAKLLQRKAAIIINTDNMQSYTTFSCSNNPNHLLSTD